jgi:hypothetical protein
LGNFKDAAFVTRRGHFCFTVGEEEEEGEDGEEEEGVEYKDSSTSGQWYPDVQSKSCFAVGLQRIYPMRG